MEPNAIAQEIHDAVGHHVSLIALQAGIALHLFGQDPEHTRRTLEAIAQHSHDLLDELRLVLGGVSPGSMPGLDRIQRLVADAREAGFAVTIDVDEGPNPLPAALEAAACGIVREALTNIRRHAAAARVWVHVCSEAGGWRVRVDDDGRVPTTRDAPEGRGIAGMRARAEAVGGHLTTGPRPDQGFRVDAWLPSANGASLCATPQCAACR